MDCRNLRMNIGRSFETSETTITKTYRDIPDDLKNTTIRKHKIRKAYMGADKSLVRPGRKQATVTEDFGVHIPYLLS